jgi:hypothetical protein
MVGLVVFLGLTTYALLTRRQLPTIRMANGSGTPELALGLQQRFHIFLSHVWATGQGASLALNLVVY